MDTDILGHSPAHVYACAPALATFYSAATEQAAFVDSTGYCSVGTLGFLALARDTVSIQL